VHAPKAGLSVRKPDSCCLVPVRVPDEVRVY
jgi:hypothetical protein